VARCGKETFVRHETLILAAVALGVLACKKGDEAAPAAPPGTHVVAITVDTKGFTPSAIDVKKGEKTQLSFTRTTDDTCAKQVVFPEIGLTKDLPLAKAVPIDVPVDTARTLTFQCGMGMYKSKVVVQ
jgi:plastocyanin domain-containing protein